MDPLLLVTRILLDNYLIVVGLAALCCIGICYFTGEARKIQEFPTLSFSLPLLSYVGTIRYFKDPRKFVADGIRKWSGKPFRIPSPTAWWIIISEQNLVDDLQKAPEHILSATQALEEEIQARYTLGPHILDDPYHFGIVTTHFSRALPQLLPELHDEMVVALNKWIPPTEDWVPVKALDTMKNTIAAMSGRIFIGLPLSRNPDWIQLTMDYTENLVKTAFLLRAFPTFLRPYLNFLMSKVTNYQRDGLKYLSPLIASRRQEREKSGQGYERPVDLLDWLLDKARGEEKEDRFIASRIFSVYFASTHTTSMTLTQALFDLALYPEYWASLREEIEEIVKDEGWSKAALDKMSKLDSFIKESQRLHPTATCIMARRALVDYTFSDGTTVPAGSTISVSATHTHLNPDTYEDPLKFDGFRFLKMKERAEADGLVDKRFDLVTTDVQFVAFGHGRHACPGRFLATTEIKLIVAYILTTYDMKFANDSRPSDWLLFHVQLPNPTANILFRKRKVDKC